MASFELSHVDDQQLDWVILRDGGIALYWRPEILADDLNWFQAESYLIHSFDAAEWHSERAMHEALQRALGFPEWYGRNLDALNDCIREDIAIPENSGLLLVFYHYDHFARATQDVSKREYAETVLDIFADAIRYHSLLGRRFVVLIQSDDAKIQFRRLGGIAAIWNWRERLNKNRGL